MVRVCWMGALCLFAAVGCVKSDGLECAAGLRCPIGTVCDDAHDSCADFGQVTACEGLGNGDRCEYLGIDGVCDSDVCVTATCGDGYVSITEACDDGNVVGGDGCSADCQSSELCGNGIVDVALGETCDCGASELSDDCLLFNSDNAGATCRTNCTLHCGDGLVNAAEECDSTPPPGGCLAFGFDRGPTGCSNACGIMFAECGRFGFTSLGGPGLAGHNAARMWAADTGEVYVSGGQYVGIYDSDKWSVTFLDADDWRGIDGSSKDFVAAIGLFEYYVGLDKRILSTIGQVWDGTEWSLLPLPLTDLGFDIAAGADILVLAPDDILYVQTVQNESPKLPLIHGVWGYDGATWALKIGQGGGNILRAAAKIGDGPDAVVVGSNGTVLKRIDGTWLPPETVAGSPSFDDVWAPAADDIYAAVGTGGVYHYDGNTWEAMTMPPSVAAIPVFGITGVGGDVYGSGPNGTIIHYDGRGWYPLHAALGTEDIGAISVRSGILHVATSAFELHRHEGASWGKLPLAGGANATAISAGGDVVYAAYGGELYRYDGTDVTALGNVGRVDSLHVIGPDQLLLESGASVALYDGQLTTLMTSGVGEGGGLAVESASHFYFGASSKVIEYENGTETTTDIPLPADYLVDMAMAGGVAYAISHLGKIWSNQGGSWTLAFDTGEVLTAMWGATDGTVLVGGDAGALWRYDGDRWLPQRFQTSERVIDISGSSSTDAFAVTFSGLHHFDGTVWSPVNRLGVDLDQVAVTSGNVFFTSQTGSLQRLERPTPW